MPILLFVPYLIIKPFDVLPDLGWNGLGIRIEAELLQIFLVVLAEEGGRAAGLRFEAGELGSDVALDGHQYYVLQRGVGEHTEGTL